MFVATNRQYTGSDATGLTRGRSRFLLIICVTQATNVRIHGASPWHLLLIQQSLEKAGLLLANDFKRSN